MFANRRFSIFLLAVCISIAALSAAAYGAEDTRARSMAEQKRASPKEQVIYRDLNDTYLGLKVRFEPDDGSDYYDVARIDVVDENGAAAQAMVYVCRGSDSYTENFRKYLSELEAAYGHCNTPPAGYLDLWWDNRIRNWVPGDFFSLEQTTLTDPDGFTHDVTVIAAGGSDTFMERYRALRAQYLKEKYGRIY